MAPNATSKLPGPPMLADADSVAVPLRVSVAPAAGAKLPVPFITVRERVPLLICTEPVLVQGTETVVVPVPAAFRRVPPLASSGVPEFATKALPSVCRSKVAPGALLNTAPLKVICPPVHAPGPPFTSVPPPIVLKPPLIVSPPPANTTRLAPTFPKVPPLQAEGPNTVMDIVPWRTPEEKLNEAGVSVPLPLNETVPPLMTSGALVMIQVPSSLAVPPLKVLVPPILSVP